MPRARCAAAPSGSLWQGVHFYATCWRCLAACRVGLLSLRKNRNANSRPADLRVVNRRGLWTRVQARQPRSARLWHLRGEHPGGNACAAASTQGQLTCPVGGGALPTAREVPRGSNSVHAHASGTRSAAPRGICRVTAIVCCSIRQTSAGYWPPSIHGEPLARVSPEAIDGRERPLARTYSSGPTDGARGRSRAVQLWPV